MRDAEGSVPQLVERHTQSLETAAEGIGRAAESNAHMRRRLKEASRHHGGLVHLEQPFGERRGVIDALQPRERDGAACRDPLEVGPTGIEKLAYRPVRIQQRGGAGAKVVEMREGECRQPFGHD